MAVRRGTRIGRQAKLVIAGVIAAVGIASGVFAVGASSADALSVPCSLDGQNFSCVLPASTVTVTQDPVTETVTSTPDPVTVTASGPTVTSSTTALATVTVTKTTAKGTVTVTASPSSTVAPTTSTQPVTTPPSTTSAATTVSTTPISSGAFPDASDTGVPAGIALTKTGSITTTSDGQIIQNVEVDGCITVKNNNVTIKNVLVKSSACFFLIENDVNTGLTMTDVEIDGQGNHTATGIGGAHWTALRLNVHGTGDGLKLGEQTSITDSYIHDLVGVSADHNDGMQLSDGNHVRVIHNTILISLKSATSALLAKADFGPINDFVMDHNLVGGGAWTVYAGSEAGNCGCGPATNVTITNNTFSTKYFPKSGGFGPLTDLEPSYVVSGNAFDTGGVVN